ncbi:ketosteroid isomerase-like protein [Crossiella equi]|uniref:Ketosteroid isomerase-like protein n=1 Tax=Crossiella equi TaxID=130796 RepID=A0ABS5A5D8_9PSEU|nr:nuclear transport factor 2 family protein [Crossiella equi]MBP2471803.1 ketosteroid isomerase-like protein [Crossiella equi]
MTTNIATEFFELLGRGHIDGAMALTTDDFTWTVGGKPGGPFALAGTYDSAAYIEMLGHVAASIPAGPQVEIVSVTQGSDRIVVETHVVGNSADGVGYDNNLVCVFDISDGRIAAVREYLDTIHASEVFTRNDRGSGDRSCR